MKHFFAVLFMLIFTVSMMNAQDEKPDRFGFYVAPKYSFHQSDYQHNYGFDEYPATTHKFTEFNGFGINLGVNFENYIGNNTYIVYSVGYAFTNGDNSAETPFNMTIVVMDEKGNPTGEEVNVSGRYDMIVDNSFHSVQAAVGIKNNFYGDFFAAAFLKTDYIFESNFLSENEVLSIDKPNYRDIAGQRMEASGAYNKSFLTAIDVSLEYEISQPSYNIVPFIRFSKGLWSVAYEDDNSGCFLCNDEPDDIVFNSLMLGVMINLK